MEVATEVQLNYPIPPRSEQDAIREGIELRRAGDINLWQQGWHAQIVTERFGSPFFAHYAAQIGRPITTLGRIRWVASRYTPEIVNKFPGLPFTFFEIVTPLMEEDPDAAIQMLERAFDTPDITCEQFAALVNPSDDLDHVPPFHSEGTFEGIALNDGSFIIGIRVTSEVTTWQRKVKESPLYGSFARLSVSQISV